MFFFLFHLRNFVQMQEVCACGRCKFNNRIAMLKRTMIGLKYYASFVSPFYIFLRALRKQDKNTADFILTGGGEGSLFIHVSIS